MRKVYNVLLLKYIIAKIVTFKVCTITYKINVCCCMHK